MELDYEQYAGQALDLADVVISTDLSEIVDSMCQESIQNQDYPESPPDSGSEHLLSPGSSMINPGFVGSVEDYTIENPSATYTSSSMLPDLSKVNYSVPMQMIEDDYKVLKNIEKKLRIIFTFVVFYRALLFMEVLSCTRINLNNRHCMVKGEEQLLKSLH